MLLRLAAALLASVGAAQTDPLPSWNEGPAKRGVIAFVQTMTDCASPRYVPPEERIATLDKALDEARVKGWLVVDMKRDWKVIFPFDR